MEVNLQPLSSWDPVGWRVAHLGYVQLRPGDVGQLGARLDEDLWEVVVVMARGHHVETHQDVEGEGEHGQIPAAVDGRQGAGHYWTERMSLLDALVYSMCSQNYRH